MARRYHAKAALAVFLCLTAAPALRAVSTDHEAGHFARCEGSGRVTCVVDGDTFWYRGDKIRIADINAPEVSHPSCPYEAALGARATDRLLALLNQGTFTLASGSRDRDRYGRLLRTVTRGGASVGEELVAEGLAETWKGYRGNWCSAQDRT
jgi:micrococcal nuclease